MGTVDSTAAPGADAAPAAKIEARDVRLGYVMDRGRAYLPVSEHLELQIQEGEFVAVVGRSGCGKSTLVHALQGLVNIDGGQLLVDGTEIRGPRREHALVFQDASLFPWRSTWRNVTYGLEVQGRTNPETLAYCRELIRITGLEDFVDSRPHQLSGGMRQRTNLARALALDPTLLLLDEPFAALDAQTRQAMQLELVRIWAETEELSRSPKTAVFITHDIAEAVFVADRVLVMSHRPSQVSADISIELPTPRQAEVKASPEFHAYVTQIEQLLDATSLTLPDTDAAEALA